MSCPVRFWYVTIGFAPAGHHRLGASAAARARRCFDASPVGSPVGSATAKAHRCVDAACIITAQSQYPTEMPVPSIITSKYR